MIKHSFSVEHGATVNNPSEYELPNLISALDGIDTTYACLTSDGKGYIQAGGGPNIFTVEVRQTISGTKFRHLKAGRGDPSSTSQTIYIGGVYVRVRADQALTREDVVAAFRQFLLSGERSRSFAWEDITSMFM